MDVLDKAVYFSLGLAIASGLTIFSFASYLPEESLIMGSITPLTVLLTGFIGTFWLSIMASEKILPIREGYDKKELVRAIEKMINKL